MTDESTELRRINWGETFPFTKIFQSFKMAVHLSKLLLALGAILLILGGGWVMDRAFWMVGQEVRDGEIRDHIRMRPSAFADATDQWEDGRLAKAAAVQAQLQNEAFDLSGFLKAAGGMNPRLAKAFGDKIKEQNKGKDRPKGTAASILKSAEAEEEDYDDLLDKARDARDDALDRVEDMWDGACDTAWDDLKKAEVGEGKVFAKKEDKEKAQDELEEAIDNLPMIKTQFRVMFAELERQIEGAPIGKSLLEWERRCFWNAVIALRYGNFTGRLCDYRATLNRRAVPTQLDVAKQTGGMNFVDPQVPGPEPIPGTDSPGFLFWVLMGLHGLIWMVSTHWVYALIFALYALIVWSIFGGAIYRIAAVQAAREEKISMRQALRFSFDKVLSFVSAPLIPIIFLVVVGLLLSAGGLLGNIPFIGPIIMGALFFLALVGGLLIALGAIALAGGCPLMYPTIAVEGSDSFDAMSRSISYIFQRPWHAIFYSAVAAIYGVITFLFVRLVAFVLLTATHAFVSFGVFTGGATLSPDADKLDVLWTAPTFENLLPPANSLAMGGGETVGAFLIFLWVGLVVLLALAYVPSFFASASTVIYYLLRRNVDATDLDDVYIEEIEEEEEYAPAEGEVDIPTGAPDDEGEEEAPAEEPPAEEAPAEEEAPADQAPADEPAADGEGEEEEKSE